MGDLKKWKSMGSKRKKGFKRSLKSRVSGLEKDMRPEIKLVRTEMAVTVVDTGNIIHLTPVAQGITVNERIGNTVRLSSLYIKGEVLMNTAAQSSTFKLLVVRDRNSSGNPPAVADILDLAASAALRPYSGNSIGNRKRFDFMYSSLTTLNNTGANTLPIKIYLNKKKSVNYTGPGDDDEGYGQIYLCLISGQSSGGGVAPTLKAICQFTFTDV